MLLIKGIEKIADMQVLPIKDLKRELIRKAVSVESARDKRGKVGRRAGDRCGVGMIQEIITNNTTTLLVIQYNYFMVNIRTKVKNGNWRTKQFEGKSTTG